MPKECKDCQKFHDAIDEALEDWEFAMENFKAAEAHYVGTVFGECLRSLWYDFNRIRDTLIDPRKVPHV